MTYLKQKDNLTTEAPLKDELVVEDALGKGPTPDGCDES